MPPITARRAAEAGDRWRSGVLSLPGAMTFPVDMPWSIACLEPGNGSAVRLLHHTYRLRFREDRNNRMPAHRPGGELKGIPHGSYGEYTAWNSLLAQQFYVSPWLTWRLVCLGPRAAPARPPPTRPTS